MKHTKLVFSISLAMMSLLTLGQSFKDSTKIYSHIGVRELESYYGFPQLEILTIDKRIGDSIYYKVIREHEYKWNYDSSMLYRINAYYGGQDYLDFYVKDTLHLLEVAGKIYAIEPFHSKVAHDSIVLIFDFSKKAGESFEYRFDAENAAYFQIDSVVETTQANGEKVAMHYGMITFNEGPSILFSMAKNIGCTNIFGVTGWLDWMVEMFKYSERDWGISTMSYIVCHNDSLLYKNDVISSKYDSDFCDKDSFFTRHRFKESSVLKLSAQQLLKVYPNPASNFLQIARIDNTPLHFMETQILNNIGQVVLETKAHRIDIAALPNGIYFIKIIDTQNHTFETHKISIQR